jgi:uncharacterized protein (TIGR00661 family)
VKFYFIVQGEGRGHMTQAISMHDILVRNGHEVVEILIGKSRQREIPKFFYDKIQTPVFAYESPNFQMTHNNKGIEVYKSIFYGLSHSRTYFQSIALIKNRIKAQKPDVVVNFYEMLAGITWMLYRPKASYICVGHQFLLLHPEFVFPKAHRFQIKLLNFLTILTSIGAQKRLALSFSPKSDIPGKKIFVVPPLLRKEVLELIPGNGDFLLGYILNAGYSEEIIRWHKTKPDVVAHFFWDKKDAPEDIEIEPNLYFHRINDTKFLNYMKDCKGYASTSGFESICEAMYLRKPVLLVPTAGHIEQRCNSIDAVSAGAGIASESFDIDKLIEFIPTYNKNDNQFIQWEKQAEQKFLELLTK